METLEVYHFRFNGIGDYHDRYVEFVTKEGYENYKTYDEIINSVKKEIINNGHFHLWQIEILNDEYAKRIDMLDESLRDSSRYKNKICRELQSVIVKPWWIAGKLDKLSTTNYHYKNMLPSVSSIRRMCDTPYRCANNVRRDIITFLRSKGGVELVNKFHRYCEGYVNAPSRELNAVAETKTKVTMSIPDYHNVCKIALKNYFNNPRYTLEGHLIELYKKDKRIFPGLDKFLVEHRDSYQMNHSSVKGYLALCKDRDRASGKVGIRLVYANCESYKNRIALTGRMAAGISALITDYFQCRYNGWVYEDEHPELYKRINTINNYLNLVYGYIIPEQGDLNGK